MEKKLSKKSTQKKTEKKVKSNISKKKIVSKKEGVSKVFGNKIISIKAESDDGETEVKIRTSKEKIEFVLKTTNEKTILSEILKRTESNLDKLKKLVEFEEDD